jgi:hypothetical protein
MTTPHSIDTPEFQELFQNARWSDKGGVKLRKLISHINAFVAKAEQDAYNIARAEFELYHKKRVAEVVKKQMEKDARICEEHADEWTDGVQYAAAIREQ